MSTLVLVKLNPIDADKIAEYSKRAAETLAAFGGEFIAKGDLSALHGETKFAKSVVIAFPDYDKAVGWYNSPAYQDLIALRDAGMESQFLVIA